jgi:hypothetical protein
MSTTRKKKPKPKNHFEKTVLPSKKLTKKKVKEIDVLEKRFKKVVRRVSPKNFLLAGKRENIPVDKLLEDARRIFPDFSLKELKAFLK